MVEYLEDIQLYWPSWDKKTYPNFNYIMKHLQDMDFAIEKTLTRGVCIQAGGHAGLWPIRLGTFFEQVFTFEPDPDLFDCLIRNAAGSKNVFEYNAALSEDTTARKLKRSGSSGSNRISEDGMDIDSVTIDSINLARCDAIFLDVEHHELQALQGAIETIKAFSPVIQVEELDPTDDRVSQFLAKLNYSKVKKCGKDNVYVRR